MNPTPNERASKGRVGRLLEAGCVGAASVALVGVVESALLETVFDPPDPVGLVRRSLLVYGASGALLGLAWGALVAELESRRQDDPRLAIRGALAWIALVLACLATTRLLWLYGKLGSLAVAVASAELLLGGFGLYVLWRRARRGGRSFRPARPGRTALLTGAALGAAWTLSGFPSRFERSASDAVNVLLVVMDTTRSDRLSPYGYGSEITPTLDRLASEGTVFTRAYSASPWTLPSHVSIFTGVYPSIHGATTEYSRLDEGPETLAERLAARGFDTGAISKKSWLSRETGVFRGFDEIHDLDDPEPLPALLELRRLVERRWRRPQDKGAAEVTATARAWLQRSRGRPFFLFLNYNEPHYELSPPSPFRERYLGEVEPAWGSEGGPDLIRLQLGEIELSDRDFEVLSRLYDASVAYQDWRMGQLFEALETSGLFDRTLVIVTADHGELLGEHRTYGHNLSVANPLLQVPLMVRLPGVVPAGGRLDQPVETRRIPNLVDLVLTRSEEGRSLSAEELVGVLSGAEDGAVIAEVYRPQIGRLDSGELPSDPRFHRRRKVVVLNDVKYVWSSDGEDELYDLRSDPGELHNLASERTELRDELRERLLSEAGLWTQQADRPAPELSDELRERLRAMGYLSSSPGEQIEGPPGSR
jgi:arylsulfatase A-like enzyme